MPAKKKKSPVVMAAEIIGRQLVKEYGWLVDDDAEDCDGQYLHVWRDKKTGYHEVSIVAADISAEGNGTCVAHLSYGDGEDECFDVGIVLRDWKTDLSELDAELKRAFRTPDNVVNFPFLANVPAEGKLSRAVEVYFKKEGKDAKGIARMIREYNKKDPAYFRSVMDEKGFGTIKELAEYMAR